MSSNIEKGDCVMFSRAFLRNTGQFTGPVPFAKGIVSDIIDLGDDLLIARIRWGDGSTTRANVKNLIRCDRRHLEPV